MKNTLQFKRVGNVYYYRFSASSEWIIDWKRTAANEEFRR